MFWKTDGIVPLFPAALTVFFALIGMGEARYGLAFASRGVEVDGRAGAAHPSRSR
jgi:hypothetical protein